MKKTGVFLLVGIGLLGLLILMTKRFNTKLENGVSNQGEIKLSFPASPSPKTTINQNTKPPGETMKTINDYPPIAATQATLATTKGNITFKLFREQAPITTLNFLTLAKQGFYDGIVFHRVIPDFMAQVGDPLTKEAGKEGVWGSGGPGYVIPDEFSPQLTHSKPGIVSMANRGPNTGGSQFFITYEATSWLDGKHAIFGEVTEGMGVLENITVGDKIISVSYQ